MNKTMVLAIVATMAVIGSGCGRQCKKAREEILQPAQVVTTYLDTNPDGETLANSGCETILTQFAKIPHGAQVVRRIAENRFSHVNSRCLYWQTDYRYTCVSRPYPHRPVCYSQPYTYCAGWDHTVVHEPGYAEAMALSTKLDTLFARTNQMCGQANAGNISEAYVLSRELLRYIANDVKPDGDRVYAMACGR